MCALLLPFEQQGDVAESSEPCVHIHKFQVYLGETLNPYQLQEGWAATDSDLWPSWMGVTQYSQDTRHKIIIIIKISQNQSSY